MLAELLNEPAINELASERAFAGGDEYFKNGQVSGLRDDNGAITGRVHGTYYYSVKTMAESEQDRLRLQLSGGTRRQFLANTASLWAASPD